MPAPPAVTIKGYFVDLKCRFENINFGIKEHQPVSNLLRTGGEQWKRLEIAISQAKSTPI